MHRRTTVIAVVGAVLASTFTLALGSGPVAAAPTCSLTRITNAPQPSREPEYSADGSSIVFTSQANLTGQNADETRATFRHRATGLQQITTAATTFGPTTSQSGNVIAFESNANLDDNPGFRNNVFRSSGASFSNLSDNDEVGIVGGATMNDNGFVTYFISDRNLTGSNSEHNVELFRHSTFGMPALTQVTDGGAGAAPIQQPQSSGQGLRVAFSTTRNLTGGNADGSTEVFLWTLGSGFTQLSDTGATGFAELPSVNRDGTAVSFFGAGAVNGLGAAGVQGIYRWVEGSGVEAVSAGTGAAYSRNTIDGTGNRVAFVSTGNLTGQNAEGNAEVFRWEGAADEVHQLTEGNDLMADLSTDGVGARVAFQSTQALAGANADSEPEVYRLLCRSFSDASSSHPFFDDIEWMAASGVSTGFADGTYRPSANVSRQAMSAFMYRLAGEPFFPPPPFPEFDDVDNDHPFYREIEWMAFFGITNGYDDGTYRPSAPVSRGAMSAFMYRLAGEPAYAPPPASTFSDLGTTHPFFKEIEWMNSTSITTGYADGTYRPAAPVSRQAMSAFMRRLAEGPGVDV